MQINGSVEIISSKERIGVVGVAWNPETVPLVVGVLHGISGMAPQEPQERPTGRTPLAQWSGIDPQGRDVTVMLWEETPFEETYAATIGPGLVEE